METESDREETERRREKKNRLYRVKSGEAPPPP